LPIGKSAKRGGRGSLRDGFDQDHWRGGHDLIFAFYSYLSNGEILILSLVSGFFPLKS
jgi:hypothetical protein